jgi:hypothetical protein
LAHDAFISYSHMDKLTAEAVCVALEAAGIRCWIAPRDIAPGAEWGESIVNGIDRCPVMVLIFSSNANESRQVRREVERAVNRGLTIVPMRLEQTEPRRSLAYFLAGIHWLDALTPPPGTASPTACRIGKSILANCDGGCCGPERRRRSTAT